MNNELYKTANRRLANTHFCLNIEGVPVEILSLSYIYYADGRNTPYYVPTRHRHTFYEAHIFVEGSQTYEIDGQTVQAQKGEVFCTSPNIFHSIPERTQVLDKCAVCFTVCGANTRANADWASFLREERFFLREDTQGLKELFGLILDETSGANTGWQEAVKNLISVLILKIARLPAPVKNASGSADAVFELERRMMTAEKFIRANLAYSISCSDVADFLHLSVRQLNRDSVIRYGMTMKKYIDTVRYERARALMKNSTMSVIQIAMEVGFRDRGDFHRFFKRMGGISPSVYYTEQKKAAK